MNIAKPTPFRISFPLGALFVSLSMESTVLRVSCA